MKLQSLKITAGFEKPIGKMEIEILLETNRELTHEEKFEAENFMRNFMRKIARNTLKTDSTLIKQVEDQKNEILSWFNGANIYVQNIKNQYDSESLFPWYKITTRRGHFVVGRRNRVCVIDWSETDITMKGYDFEHDVTKGDKYIHAWTNEDAENYIETLMLS